MKIGLVRHFKVKKGYPTKGLITRDELIQWFEEYDVSDIENGETDLLGIEWKRCFASDMSRAVKTAENIYNGKVIKTKELREIPLPSFRINMKLPFLGWAVLVKISSLISHKNRLEIKDAKKRIETVLDEILLQGEEDVLIVSHAALMMFMRKELLKRGFKGPTFKTPENGKLYIFEK